MVLTHDSTFSCFSSFQKKYFLDFPFPKHFHLLRESEKEWVDAWVEHMKDVPSDDVLQGDLEYGYDPTSLGC